MNTHKRLEELRTILRSESMSYDELHELQDFGERGLIDPGDVELLEAAGVPEQSEAEIRKPHVRPGLASMVEAKDKEMPFPTVHLDVDGIRVANYLERDDAAELVRRWNAYPELTLRVSELACACEELLHHTNGSRGEWSDPLGTAEDVMTEARKFLATLNT